MDCLGLFAAAALNRKVRFPFLGRFRFDAIQCSAAFFHRQNILLDFAFALPDALQDGLFRFDIFLRSQINVAALFPAALDPAEFHRSCILNFFVSFFFCDSFNYSRRHNPALSFFHRKSVFLAGKFFDNPPCNIGYTSFSVSG